ncbi:hypothetical protein MNBD_DELTA03-1034 [hydrothermal vent metagenome]|uniref:Uncharacterized protein n=1 Tax=hydrothermal vent metagenome TaxID=652676 RepID=A0A3B0V761_9ZZZZ
MTCAIENIEGAQYQIRQTAMNHVIVSLVQMMIPFFEKWCWKGPAEVDIQGIINQLLPDAEVKIYKVKKIYREKSGEFKVFKSMLVNRGTA